MTKYLIRRLLNYVVLLFVAVTIAYFGWHAAFDPLSMLIENRRRRWPTRATLRLFVP